MIERAKALVLEYIDKHMKDAEEDDGYSGAYRGRSYAHGRDARGRYMRSRDMEYSGHYPMDYVDPYWDRRY